MSDIWSSSTYTCRLPVIWAEVLLLSNGHRVGRDSADTTVEPGRNHHSVRQWCCDTDTNQISCFAAVRVPGSDLEGILLFCDSAEQSDIWMESLTLAFLTLECNSPTVLLNHTLQTDPAPLQAAAGLKEASTVRVPQHENGSNAAGVMHCQCTA
jgi:hypothetical protein